MEKEKTKILVCGATGFIGRNMAEFFASQSDTEVFGVYHHQKPYDVSGITFVRADLRNQEETERVVQGMDVIIQAAATTSGAHDVIHNPHRFVADNVIMNTQLFRAAFEAKVKHVIFFSCSVMYQPSDTPLKETDFDANKEMVKNYFGGGWMKVYSEKMCEFYSRVSTTKFTVIRHSNIYGPHDNYDLQTSHVFGATLAKVMQAEYKVTVWGDGSEERDLLYVGDLADFVDLALKKQETPFGLFNAGLGKSIAIRDLVAKVIKYSGKKLDIVYDTTKPTIKTKLCLDSTKAMEIFGWTPETSLDEGIKKTIAWYRKNVMEK
ncbi:MAG: NAD-dependent epimerase/dehydratase family protein [Candidatus Sungbacteria bacterium]|nr:NAD-dependent epimerase/dehydratase family protein [Candidatus Sungbacteria bacterium]